MKKEDIALKYIEDILKYLYGAASIGASPVHVDNMLKNFHADVETTRLEDSLPDEAE